MNIELFKKVTKEKENGDLKGISINDVSEYIEPMKKFKREFNTFVYSLENEELEAIGLHNNYQNSGYYNKYFWGKLRCKEQAYQNEELLIWIGIEISGLYVYIGTSDNSQLNGKEIYSFLAEHIDKNKLFKDFIFDNTSEYFRYKYIGDLNNIDKNDFLVLLDYITPIYKKAIEKFILNDINKKIFEVRKIMEIKNIVLYGAPGVGKTHNYKNLISMIEEGKSQNEIFDTISKNNEVSLDNDVFETIKQDKRVEFVTFHQSYSYEDFIEGFRPNESGKIALEDGIFKRISDNASNNIKEKQYKHISFEEAYEIFREQYINGELETLKTVSNAEIMIDEFKEKSIRAQTENAKDLQYIKKSDLEVVVNGILNNLVSKPADIRQLAVKKDTFSLAGYYFPFANKIVEIMKKNKVSVEEEKNFYIVIDEINRGNISKIFGELITLIEEDKRDKYEVMLPYSKVLFKVPSNLYIIATMNSTDKSIATIDIALRRRFTFLKMKPNENLIKNVNAKELFNRLNSFIKEKLSEDYMLGHSYFMNIHNSEDLDFVKEYKIKPLLEEYFYADDENFKKVEEILNKSDSTKAEND